MKRSGAAGGAASANSVDSHDPRSLVLAGCGTCARTSQETMNREQRPRQDRGKISLNTSYGLAVPTIQQVIPGAAVSIVLKVDQATGREVQGTVKDLLTRGNHPRGIKVRLQDGRVGRVQRMVAGGTHVPTGSTGTMEPHGEGGRRAQNPVLEGAHFPPLRTLADYLPPEPAQTGFTAPQQRVSQGTETVKCPFCHAFEGDEAAVSHHVEVHLS